LTRGDIRINSRSRRSIITKEEPRISIIIPCRAIDAYTKECIDNCLKIEYSNYEILVLPDYYDNSEVADKLVRIIPTGPMRPMAKRLLGGSMSKGALCAFIDSDAFPAKNWIRNAIHHFKDSEVAAVVGPSLTPDADNLLAKASGFVLASPLGSGSESIRYSQTHSRIRYVLEAPACNFIISKSDLKAVNDFVSDVWPGEEIVLCGVVTKNLKKRIIYDNQVVVYHHRRPLFIPHLKQVWKYGLVKGFLLKSCREYIRLRFFAPSLLLLGIIVGFFPAIINPIIAYAYILSISGYVLVSLFNAVLIGMRQKNLRVIFLTFVGVIATHICYGLAFIKGVLSRKL